MQDFELIKASIVITWFCKRCDCEVNECDNCLIHFTADETILCSRYGAGKHYCLGCEDYIKKKNAKIKRGKL